MSGGTSAISLSTIASVGGLVGTAVSALGAIQQGKAAQQSANYNAQVQQNNATLAKQNATLAGQEGAANTAITQQRTRASVGEIKAAQAASGIDVNKGSAVDVQSSASELGELNAITVRNNAVRQAYGYQTQAASDTAQAQLDQQQGKYASEAGGIKAATTLLGNASSGSSSGLWDSFTDSKSLNFDSGMPVSGYYGG